MSEENVVETSEEVQGNPDVEKEARLFGWVPQEEFRGDVSEWRDAEAFVKKGREINGFLRKDRERLMQELGKRDSKMAEMENAIKEFREFHSQTEERAYKRALEDLKAAKKEAIALGDGEKVVELDDAIDELKDSRQAAPKQVQQPAQAQQPVLDPLFVQWNQENTWFGADQGLTAAANGLAEALRITHPHLAGKDFLDEVTRLTKKEFPEKFQNKNRNRATVEGSTGGQPVGGTGHSYSDMPKEAREACDKFVAQKLITKEQYVKDYFGV